jgi:phage terminase large subunit
VQQATAEELTFLTRIQSDPVFFDVELLGGNPWSTQRTIMESVRDHPRVAVRSCHGAGKSHVAARIALWFLYSFFRSIVITTAPTGRQVQRILWQELRRAHTNARVALGGRLGMKDLQLDDGWFAFGFSTDEGDSFQGPHAEHVLFIGDEASGLDSGLWAAIDGILTSAHCRALFIGNPTNPASAFAAEAKNAATKSLHISAFDTPNFTAFGITLEDIRAGTWEAKITRPLPYPALVTPAWVADKWKRWGEASPLWLARVMGEFPEQGTDTLIPLAWVEAAQERELKPDGPHELGVDVARYGDDESVIAERRGPRVRVRLTTAKESTMETAGKVIAALTDSGATQAKIDDIGVGGGVVDRLIELKKPAVGINVGEAAHDSDRFANLRAELWWNVRELAETGQLDLDPHDEELAAELTAIKFKYTSKGQIIIEPKEETKKRLKRSPDRADAVMLSFAKRFVQVWKAV